MPASERRSSTRSRKTSPRGFDMSKRPTVRPSRIPVEPSATGVQAKVRQLGLLIGSITNLHSYGMEPLGPLAIQPPMIAENMPAPPPALTIMRPPGRNLLNVLSAKCSGIPSAIPPAPATSSCPGSQGVLLIEREPLPCSNLPLEKSVRAPGKQPKSHRLPVHF